MDLTRFKLGVGQLTLFCTGNKSKHWGSNFCSDSLKGGGLMVTNYGGKEWEDGRWRFCEHPQGMAIRG